MGSVEASRKWRERMREAGRCLLCGGIWDGAATLCDACRARAAAQRAARSQARMARFRELGQVPRTRGAGGFAAHPENRYQCTPEERARRGKAGTAVSAQRRRTSVKWTAVTAALASCEAAGKRGPGWELLADFYDLAYSRGYAAAMGARARARKLRGTAAA